jgi:hypothetical protein
VSRESEFAVDSETEIETDSSASEDGSDEEQNGQVELTPAAVAPEYVAPTPLADPSEIALTATFADGDIEITHGEWFDLLDSSAGNEDFVTRILGGFVPDGFGTSLLTEMFAAQALGFELAEFETSASDQEQDDARALLVNGLSQRYYFTESDPAAAAEESVDAVAYWQFLTAYGADQAAIERAWTDNADPADGEPCVSHLLVDTEDEANEALARIEGGEAFADVALEVSTDTGSAQQGGNLGCSDPGLYVAEFAAAIETAELDQLVGPVETQFGFHLLVVTGYEVNGVALAVESLTERLVGAEVTVDPRIGEWSPEQLSVVPTA